MTPLPDPAGCWNYFLARFEWGGPVAERLARVPPFSHFSTFLPPNDRLMDLGSGGHKERGPFFTVPGGVIERVRDDDEILVDWISRRAASDLTLLFDHAWARPTDPYLEEIEAPWMSVEDRIAFVLSGSALQDRAGTLSALWASGPRRLGILSDGGMPARLTRGESLPTGVLDRLVERARFLFTDAYDGESYVIAPRHEIACDA